MSGAAVEAEPCPCEWAEHEAFHDRLLTFEERGIEGVVWLLDSLAAHAEEEPSPDHPLAWTELLRCVAEHNWQHPLAVARLAVEVQELFALRGRAPAGGRPPWN